MDANRKRDKDRNGKGNRHTGEGHTLALRGTHNDLERKTDRY